MLDFTITPNISIRNAMKELNNTGQKCLVIINDENKLYGTLSDGDIRKAILKGRGFEDQIKFICQKNPAVLIQNEYSLSQAKTLFIDSKFDLIPVVDSENKLVDILFLDSVLSGKELLINKMNLPVVIMAGGKGKRLEPFTSILPKPLVPVHEKPIIEHIIDYFIKFGCNDFFLTINYKGRILKAYFEESSPSYNVKFISEQKPLGTAGSLKLLKNNLNGPFFVTNCDIIIKADYNAFYSFHIKGGYDLSLVASEKEYIIPYGTCEINEDGNLSRINEKPKYDFLINTGLYILNSDILNYIPDDTFFHITDLINALKRDNKKIGVFPILEDNWLDIGQWNEYKRTVDKL